MQHGSDIKRINAQITETRDIGEQQDDFLKALANLVSIKASCEETNIPRHRVNEWRKNDLLFKERFEETIMYASEVLEDEAIRRGYKGIQESVFNRDGVKTGEVTKYSDNLLALLLKGRMPQKYRDKQEANEILSRQSTLLILPSNGRELEQVPQLIRGEDIRKEFTEPLKTGQELNKEDADDNYIDATPND